MVLLSTPKYCSCVLALSVSETAENSRGHFVTAVSVETSSFRFSTVIHGGFLMPAARNVPPPQSVHLYRIVLP